MGIKAHFLKDNNGNKFYPYAHASAVFDSNGQKVEKRLNDLDTNKIDKQDGKSLSSNDYTDEEKNKLASIQSNAEQNVQSDWNEIDSTSDAYIKNKPTSLPSNGGNSDTVNGHTVNSDVPANAKFTDTIYDDTEIKNSITELNSNKLDKTTVATSSTLGLVKSGTDITVDTSGNVSVNDNSHKHTVSNISDLTATASELNVLDGITATTQELNYVDGVTSNIQTQLNSKSANGHTHDDRYYTESEVDTTVSNINNSISSHTSNTSNPHSVTKAQVGLGNVENKSSATIRGEITKSNVTTALGYTPLNQSLKGSASGLAELDSNGKVPSSQLPSFVDDVVEGYLSGGKFYKESAHTTEISGETGKIYIDLSTEKTYRWSGSAFVVISETLALGETSSTAYRGDRGKTAYDHSQSTHARTDATKVEKSSTNGNIKINGTETTVYTHPSGTNPHGTTKSDVGLGNVGNFKAVSTVANQGLTDAEKANARANIGAGTSSFSGSYNDLTNKPTIPTNNNQLTNGAGYITSSGTAKTISDTLPISKGGTGKTTGVDAANTLINSLSTGESTPTDADYYISQYVGGGTSTTTYHRRPMSALWNYIKSKLATVATSGSYNDLSNKPTIPSVGNGTVTIKQAGTSKGTFTMNQTGNTTIELTDNNTTYSNFVKSGSGAKSGLVPAPSKTAGTTKYLREDGTWTVPPDTNTTYSVATTSANGLMSSSDKSKLDGIASGAEVNQNAYSKISVVGDGAIVLSANEKKSIVEFYSGKNINLSTSGTGRIIISGNDNYGTCSTAASTAAKVVSCSGYTLATGSEITVKFTVTNTASSPTLNVNNTGAKAIYYRGSAIAPGYLASNRTYTFRYNGTQYDLVGDLDTSSPDTKNTSGSGNTSKKIYLVGAISQVAGGTDTYSHKAVYVGTDNCLYSNDTRVVSEVVSSSEPSGQVTGDYWLEDYE